MLPVLVLKNQQLERQTQQLEPAWWLLTALLLMLPLQLPPHLTAAGQVMPLIPVL
jgi:hypothetical protein